MPATNVSGNSNTEKWMAAAIAILVAIVVVFVQQWISDENDVVSIEPPEFHAYLAPHSEVEIEDVLIKAESNYFAGDLIAGAFETNCNLDQFNISPVNQETQSLNRSVVGLDVSYVGNVCIAEGETREYAGILISVSSVAERAYVDTAGTDQAIQHIVVSLPEIEIKEHPWWIRFPLEIMVWLSAAVVGLFVGRAWGER